MMFLKSDSVVFIKIFALLKDSFQEYVHYKIVGEFLHMYIQSVLLWFLNLCILWKLKAQVATSLLVIHISHPYHYQ